MLLLVQEYIAHKNTLNIWNCKCVFPPEICKDISSSKSTLGYRAFLKIIVVKSLFDVLVSQESPLAGEECSVFITTFHCRSPWGEKLLICFGCRSGQKVIKSLPGQALSKNKRQVSCCWVFFFKLKPFFPPPFSLLLFLLSPPLPLSFPLSLPSGIYTNYPSCPSQYTIMMMTLEMMMMMMIIIEGNSQYMFKCSLILWLGKKICF